jgi:hypothetical protein
MTLKEAEQLLTESALMIETRTTGAVSCCCRASRHRMHQLTGIGRPTIDRILSASSAPNGAANVLPGGGMVTDADLGTCGIAQTPRSGAEARGFEPRKGANPNRISSAAP